jgi:hypothetical protein
MNELLDWIHSVRYIYISADLLDEAFFPLSIHALNLISSLIFRDRDFFIFFLLDGLDT